MNRSQFVDELAKRFDGNRKVAQHALDSVLDVITRAVAEGERVAITGFGAFERSVREAGTARNPRTGEVVKTSRRFVPKFRPGSDLKQLVNDARTARKRVVESLAVVPATALSAARAAAAGQPARSSTTKAASKATAKKTTAAKKAPAKKAPAKKATAAKTTAKKAPAKKATAKKAPAKKASAKKAPAKKAPAKKAPAKKA